MTLVGSTLVAFARPTFLAVAPVAVFVPLPLEFAGSSTGVVGSLIVLVAGYGPLAAWRVQFMGVAPSFMPSFAPFMVVTDAVMETFIAFAALIVVVVAPFDAGVEAFIAVVAPFNAFEGPLTRFMAALNSFMEPTKALMAMTAAVLTARGSGTGEAIVSGPVATS